MTQQLSTPEAPTSSPPVETIVGNRLRELRTQHGYSLRALAVRSGLNINTLSLIENGKSSASISTLQTLAEALDVPITTFFKTEPTEHTIVFTPAGNRPKATVGSAQMYHLGLNLAGNAIQPFAVTLEPGIGSGDRMTVHTGHEFIYCLSGSICFRIQNQEFTLTPGDSLVFQAHLPHCWENRGTDPVQFLLILYPADLREAPIGRHLSIGNSIKENSMKIAIITEDGKTISRHFGRAPYYLVLTIEDGQIIHKEMRSKLGHGQFQNQHQADGAHEHEHGQGHGHDTASHNKHVSMAETISDCAALICGGMGMGAYDSMRRLNIQPVITDLQDIDSAAVAFVEGRLVDHTELLH